MAATTKFLQLRSVFRPTTTSPTSIMFFSSSSNTLDPNQNPPQTDPTSPAPPPPPPHSQSPFSSHFSDVKASLRKPQQGNPQSQPLRSHFGFSSSSSSTPNAPRSIGQVQEMLSEFRRRTAVPAPSPPSSPPQRPQHLSFQELYQQKLASGGQDSSPAVSKSDKKQSLDAIRESLRHLRKPPAKNQNERVGQRNDAMSLSKFKESLKLKPGDQSERDQPMVIGGTDKLPSSIFGKEMREKEAGSANIAQFVRTYSHKELGEKLRPLRPEKKGDRKDWFSLEELNERLMKLREIEKLEGEAGNGGIFGYLKGSLEVLQNAKDQNPNNTMQRLDILSELGSTKSFMLSPPQEHLVEKYFHPDNMSASEKLKLELKKVRDEFKMSESDCGSARVQVAQLTTKIKHLATVLNKKDKHSRKGLQGMVQKRKSLLKYLRRTDWESYCFVLSKLGLRDNPDYKN